MKIDVTKVNLVIIYEIGTLRPTVTLSDVIDVVNEDKSLIEIRDGGMSDRPSVILDLRARK